MKVYKTKVGKIPGTEFKEVHKIAFRLYKSLKKKSKRRAYLRSAYFKKEKIFLDIFWQHLFEKENWRDRVRRLKYFPPAVELIEKSNLNPESKVNPNRKSEILHRFLGFTRQNELFVVQIKEMKNSKQKFLLSVFPKDSI